MTSAPLRINSILDDAAPPPRYACYPTVAQFRPGVGAEQAEAWTRMLPAGARLTLRIHIPFCERLCWFCSSRTQRVRGRGPVDALLDALAAEAARLGAMLPEGAEVVGIRWGGGSPTILDPDQMARLDASLRAALPVAPGAGFAVEVEPHGLDPDRLATLVGLGLSEAALGVPDFDQSVQAAIGRAVDPARVAGTFAALRRAGVGRIALEVLYGLPDQTAEGFAASCDRAAGFGPDQILLSGYAHVPWMARRQRMIPQARLPGAALRRAQFAAGSVRLQAAGYRACGADLLLRPDDPLARAHAEGRLRRDLGGYGDREPTASIGLGPAAVSRFPQGFVQNAGETGAYMDRLAAGRGAGTRGIVPGMEDRLRGRAIEMLFCGLKVDLVRLRDEFGDFARLLEAPCAAAVRAFPGAVRPAPDGVVLDSEVPLLAQRVAEVFDAVGRR